MIIPDRWIELKKFKNELESVILDFVREKAVDKFTYSEVTACLTSIAAHYSELDAIEVVKEKTPELEGQRTFPKL